MQERNTSIGRSTLEALLVAAATPIGLWLGWALTDSSSSLRLKLDELRDRARELEQTLREAYVRRAAADLVAEAEAAIAHDPAAEPATEETP